MQILFIKYTGVLWRVLANNYFNGIYVYNHWKINCYIAYVTNMIINNKLSYHNFYNYTANSQVSLCNHF